MKKKSKQEHDCPCLDSVQQKERKLIKTRQEIKEKESEPFFKPLVAGEGCSHENGIQVEPILDGKVRKRAKKR